MHMFVSVDESVGSFSTKYVGEAQSQNSLDEEELREASNRCTLFWGVCSISVGLTLSLGPRLVCS